MSAFERFSESPHHPLLSTRPVGAVRRLSLLPLVGLLLGGCQSQSESFSDLQPSFFAALNVFDAKAVQDLPAFETRMDRMAQATLDQVGSGALADETAHTEAGRALFYAGFLPLGANQAMYDGFVPAEGLLSPHRYAAAGSQQDELVARVSRSLALVQAAVPLRPDWAPSAAIKVGAQFDLEEAMGAISDGTIDAVMNAAQPNIFGTFSAVILMRDPAKHPFDAPYMQKLYALLCSPERFSCDKMGMPSTDPNAERMLTSFVAGPVILSDVLVRRAEYLTAQADTNPAQAMAALGEAMGRLQMAAGALLGAQLNAQTDEFALYPAIDTFDPRQERIDQVKAAVAARLAGTSPPPSLPEAQNYYQSRTYRAAYQCAACHIPRPNLPPSFQGIPK